MVMGAGSLALPVVRCEQGTVIGAAEVKAVVHPSDAGIKCWTAGLEREPRSHPQQWSLGFGLSGLSRLQVALEIPVVFAPVTP